MLKSAVKTTVNIRAYQEYGIWYWVLISIPVGSIVEPLNYCCFISLQVTICFFLCYSLFYVVVKTRTTELL